MTDRPMEREQLLAWAKPVADALSEQLGQTWAAVQDPEFSHLVTLNGPAGWRLVVSHTHGNGGKVEINGGVPDDVSKELRQDWWRHWQRCEINVSPTRSPADIAKDIVRRLLPAYQNSLIESYRKLQLALDARKANAEAVALVQQHVPGNWYLRRLNAGDDALVYEMSLFNDGQSIELQGMDTAHISGNVTLLLRRIPLSKAIEFAQQIVERGATK